MNAEFEWLADRSGHSTHLEPCRHPQTARCRYKAAVIGSEKDNSFGDLSGVPTRPMGYCLAIHKFSTALH